MSRTPRCPDCNSNLRVEQGTRPSEFVCAGCELTFDIEESADAPGVEITERVVPRYDRPEFGKGVN